MTNLNKPLRLSDAGSAAFLNTVQAGILKHHARDHAQFLFFRIGQADKARRFLKMLAEAKNAANWTGKFSGAATRVLTSALDQRDARLAVRKDGYASDPIRCLGLTANGYAKLQIPRDKQPLDAAFQEGMSARRADLRDEPWSGYLSNVDLVIILADDDKARLQAECQHVIDAAVDADLSIAGRETGKREFRKDADPAAVASRQPIEHFGWYDGISQPRMIVEDWERERSRRGAEHWTSLAALNLAFGPDYDSAPDLYFGSYMVFRKLQQIAGPDDRRFPNALTHLTHAIGDSNSGRAGAMAMGRFWEHGAPRSYTFNFPTATDDFINDFNFADDPHGNPCPYHAHIRKANPRDEHSHYDQSGRAMGYTRTNGIARRGITYADDDESKGLLFVSCQSDLARFETMQIRINDDGYDSQAGVDSICGWTGNEEPLRQSWPHVDSAKFAMNNFVSLKGGEYFFLPSLPYLQSLPQLTNATANGDSA